MARRILILSASVGAGHLRAAQAMELALKQLDPAAEVRNVDVLTLTNALFRRVYAKAYLDLVNLAPHLLGYIYDTTDVKRRTTDRGDRLRRITQHLNLHRIVDLLEEPWDIVVNTHFLPAQIISLRRRRGKTKLMQFTVVTDFDAHAFWVNEPTDRYFVPTEEAALSLGHWSVDRARVEISGIPIHPVFATPKSAAECRSRHKLDPKLPTLLLLAGGFGVGPIEKIYRAILGIERPLQVVAVAGKNAALKNKLDRVETPKRHRASVLGFTTEIDELMAAADMVVTKPGGLTTSEVLARGCAMVIMNPIPGQESRNSDYLLESGAAIKINTLAAVGHKISSLLDDPARLSSLRQSAFALGRPRAAFEIGERVLSAVAGR